MMYHSKDIFMKRCKKIIEKLSKSNKDSLISEIQSGVYNWESMRNGWMVDFLGEEEAEKFSIFLEDLSEEYMDKVKKYMKSL